MWNSKPNHSLKADFSQFLTVDFYIQLYYERELCNRDLLFLVYGSLDNLPPAIQVIILVTIK